MDISFVTFWNNYRDHLTDAEFYKKELALNHNPFARSCSSATA